MGLPPKQVPTKGDTVNVITKQIVDEARKWIGTKEVGHNDGPEVRAWLARVKRHPPAPWCAAFAWCMLDDACRSLHLRNPIEPVAGVHLFRQLGKEHDAWTTEPGAGYVFFIDHGRNALGQLVGHCGIVVDMGPASAVTIEGNTNEAGGREGDRVALRTRQLGEISLGYLDPGKLVLEAMASPLVS
jgi:hypothetical protein